MKRPYLIEELSPDCLSDERLEMHLLGVDTPSEQNEAKAHLAACSCCREAYLLIKEEHAYFAKQPIVIPFYEEEPTVSNASADKERILSGIDLFSQSVSWWERWGWQWAVGAALCGMLCVVVLSWKGPEWFSVEPTHQYQPHQSPMTQRPSKRLRQIGRLGLPVRRAMRLPRKVLPKPVTHPPRRTMTVRSVPTKRLGSYTTHAVHISFYANVPGVRLYINGRWIGVIMRPTRPLKWRLTNALHKQLGRALVAELHSPHAGGFKPSVVRRRLRIRSYTRSLRVKAVFHRTASSKRKGRMVIPKCYRAHRGAWRVVSLRGPKGTTLFLRGGCRNERIGVISPSGQLKRRMPIGIFVRIGVSFVGGQQREKIFEVIRGNGEQVLSFVPPARCSLASMQRKVEQGKTLSSAETSCLYQVASSGQSYVVAQATLAWDACLHKMYTRGRTYLFRVKRRLRRGGSIKRRLWVGRSWLACRSYSLALQTLKQGLQSTKLSERRAIWRLLSMVHNKRYDRRKNPHDLSRSIAYLQQLLASLPKHKKQARQQIMGQLMRLRQLRRLREQTHFAPR